MNHISSLKDVTHCACVYLATGGWVMLNGVEGS